MNAEWPNRNGALPNRLLNPALRPVPIASCSAESVAVKPNCPVVADMCLPRISSACFAASASLIPRAR